MHVTTFKDRSGVVISGDGPILRATTGEQLETNGTIQVDLKLDGSPDDSRDMSLVMTRGRVTRPLVTVGHTCDEGYSVGMNKYGGIIIDPDGN